MSGAFFLGWRYLRFHRLKSLVLLASVTLMMFLPVTTRLLVADSATALTALRVIRFHITREWHRRLLPAA